MRDRCHTDPASVRQRDRARQRREGGRGSARPPPTDAQLMLDLAPRAAAPTPEQVAVFD